jgi:hypothetical protein
MIRIPDPRRGIVRNVVRCSVRCSVRSLGIAAAALFVLSAAPGQRAEALSLIDPGTLPAAKHASEGLTIEVRGGHGGGGGHMGGGGGHVGGGIHVGGAAIHGGSFKSSGGSGIHISSGSGHLSSWSGHHHGRFAFRHHRFHRHFFYGAYYPYYDYPCPVVWTDYGPRRVCHWRHHYWSHYHHRRHHHAHVYS